MKILFLSRWFPFPPDNGSRIRIHNLLRGLCQEHEVSLVSYFDPGDGKDNHAKIDLPLGAVHCLPWREFNRHSIKSLLGFFAPTPRFLLDTWSPKMAALISSMAESGGFDLIVASEIPMAAYHRFFRETPAILEGLEVGSYLPANRFPNSPRGMRQRLTWLKHSAYLSRLLGRFRLCTVVSDRERALLVEIAPENTPVFTVPNFVRLEQYKEVRVLRDPTKMIFSGSFRFRPNYDAISWFIASVHPAVLSQVPDAQLVITGKDGGQKLPVTRNVTLSGYVRDVHAMVAGACVSVVPILEGGGTRLKILEAMALHTPVVSTSKGAEGLDVEDGRHILIADSPDDFARAVIRVLREPDLRRHLATNAFELVRARYDWDAVMPRFLSLVERAARG